MQPQTSPDAADDSLLSSSPPETNGNSNGVRCGGSPVTIRTFRENHKTLDELDLTELEELSQIEHRNVVRIFDMVWNINSGGVELYLVYQVERSRPLPNVFGGNYL